MNGITLNEIKEMMKHPENWYVPYILLIITPPIEENNGAQANLVEAQD